MISQRVQHPQAKYFIGEFMNDGRRNLEYICTNLQAYYFLTSNISLIKMIVNITFPTSARIMLVKIVLESVPSATNTDHHMTPQYLKEG